MTTLSDGGAGQIERDRDLITPLVSLLLLVTVLVLAAFWGAGAPDAAVAGEQKADPVRVRVPAIGVDAPVGPLYIDENGALPPPDSYDGTGWWHAGPEPGEIGPALIAGHVDSTSGPAVFFRLDELRTGDEIFVDLADGETLAFTAQRTERYAKDEFPSDEVYGDTPDPQLRLVTCGGAFDPTDRRYLDNVVVYATGGAAVA